MTDTNSGTAAVTKPGCSRFGIRTVALATSSLCLSWKVCWASLDCTKSFHDAPNSPVQHETPLLMQMPAHLFSKTMPQGMPGQDSLNSQDHAHPHIILSQIKKFDPATFSDHEAPTTPMRGQPRQRPFCPGHRSPQCRAARAKSYPLRSVW